MQREQNCSKSRATLAMLRSPVLRRPICGEIHEIRGEELLSVTYLELAYAEESSVALLSG